MPISPTTVVSGNRALWGVSDCGQLMGQESEVGLASVEPEGVYEHLAIGVLEEGYTLAYRTPGGGDNVKWDVYGSSNGINCISSTICRDDDAEFVKTTESRTDDGSIAVRQTFIISKNGTRIIIRMELTNCRRERSEDLTDFLVKRYADIDVDTGGSAGWAGFLARWDKNRSSVFTYNLDNDVTEERRRAHVVNMVAMPSDLPLDGTFVGELGAQQYPFRDNPSLLSPLPTDRVDGDGILQWRASNFLAGETFTVNMYYETFPSFSK